MINRLEAILNRYNEISKELTSPEVISNIKKMTELSKEQRRLSQTVEIYEKYKGVLSDIETAKEMLNDKDMQEFAKEEISALNTEKGFLVFESILIVISGKISEELLAFSWATNISETIW